MSHAPSDILSRRHQSIRQTLAARQLDALVVTSLPNVLYLTNFTGSAGAVVVTSRAILFITDSRYVTAVGETRGQAHECPNLELRLVGGSYDATLAATLRPLAGARVAVEGQHLSITRFQWLAATLGKGAEVPELVPTDGIVERARVTKDQYEHAVLAEAGARLSEVAARVFPIVRAGQTERELALAIDTAIRTAGFERPAFDTIVASGPHSALPHARPTERRLTEGDLVVLDFGGVYDSYCVDLTRTVAVGRASDRAREVHAAVLRAHDRAIAAVAPGASRFSIDAAARDALTQAGMGEAFSHGTGHGLGIEVHEDPRIVRRQPDSDTRDEQVTEGMVFTIEPGAYFPGFGGVRIEDDVAVSAAGAALLTNVTTGLLEL
jgi:Xaa-Pro aminopeptidase